MFSKKVGRLRVINVNGNSEAYVSLFKDSLIPSLEDQFRNCDVIFLNNNSSRHRFWIAKKIIFEDNVPHMELQTCSTDINPVKKKIWHILNNKGI